ncbi:hypothetical protein CAL12_16955 [Bordetella genomosp. 8]|uniref:Uncharacterized protein n=1 Tax=Bordetella genomosp. 8 TaxID=1416806 RepID=A0A1W6YMS2_9BORD|nr:hypothetical protein [Bordetella genomosp. 8]ARP82338.1 hypothetical protein CAL12_16955 [Bordetella genomosp. 8]
MSDKIVGGCLRIDELMDSRAQHLRKMADEIEADQYLWNPTLIAAIVRMVAAEPMRFPDLPWSRPFAILLFEGEPDFEPPVRSAGAIPKISRANVRWAFFLLVVEYGISKNLARELIAKRCDVSTEAIENALGKHMRKYCDGVLAQKIPDPRLKG